MRTCVQTFEVGLTALLEFLTVTEHETELTNLLFADAQRMDEKQRALLEQILLKRTHHKQYIYSVSIVSLYGLLERVFDSLVEAYVVNLSKSVTTFNALPETIKKNHLPLSLELAKAVATEDRRKTDSSPDEIIANLHSCLSGSSEFRMNGAAFSLHRGNITPQKIQSFLASVGIDAPYRKLSVSDALKAFYATREEGRDITKLPDQELAALFAPIDDLVERRNELSHGVINVDGIESTDLLRERCAYVAAFIESLFQVMTREFLVYRVNLTDAYSLGTPIAVYNGRIACFDSSSGVIAVGDQLVAITKDKLIPSKFGYIEEIQVNHNPMQQIVINGPTQFGLKVAFKVSDKYEYYTLPADAC